MRDYHGEGGGYKFWLKYTWVDQDLKESMTGRR